MRDLDGAFDETGWWVVGEEDWELSVARKVDCLLRRAAERLISYCSADSVERC